MVRVTDHLRSKPRRLIVFGLFTVGWLSFVMGAISGIPWLWTIGGGLLGIVGLILAKAVFELEWEALTLAARVRGLEAFSDRIGSTIDGVADTTTTLREQVESMRADPSLDHLREDVERLTDANDLMRDVLAGTRSVLNHLIGTVRMPNTHHGTTERGVGIPLLSIAIPAFNRPESLTQLLGSLAKEVSGLPRGVVEVHIADDASTDPRAVKAALEFVEAHPYASFSTQPANVGIERNILDAGRECRGDFLLLIGNDDLVAPEALSTIIHDLQTEQAKVLLYSKRRIDLQGNPHRDVDGSVPIDLPAHGWHSFPTLLSAAGRQGLLSTFGFIGPAVVLREPFLAIDPAPYLDLTMYAQVFVKVEAFSRHPVFYRNTATIVQRTPTQAQKHAEARGRREEEFMMGGQAKLSRYFGTTLAATLQRVIDRSDLEYETVAGLPERLMTPLPLIDWIIQNRKLDPSRDQGFEAEVVNDAERLLSSIAGRSRSAAST